MESTELQLAIAAALGVAFKDALMWVVKWAKDFVEGTPNKWDDKMFKAARDAVVGVAREQGWLTKGESSVDYKVRR